MNSLAPPETPTIRLIVNNLLILFIIGLADYFLFRTRGVVKMINYERLDLLDQKKCGEMEADLKTRSISKTSKSLFQKKKTNRAMAWPGTVG